MFLDVKGKWLHIFPRFRRSWMWRDFEIISPAVKNRRDLKRAWLIKWNKAKLGRCTPKAIIINLSCLKVDKAIIFFISSSLMAERLAIIRVIEEQDRRRNVKVDFSEIEGKNRIRRKTPAVTRVEE